MTVYIFKKQCLVRVFASFTAMSAHDTRKEKQTTEKQEKKTKNRKKQKRKQKWCV